MLSEAIIEGESRPDLLNEAFDTLVSEEAEYLQFGFALCSSTYATTYLESLLGMRGLESSG